MKLSQTQIQTLLAGLGVVVLLVIYVVMFNSIKNQNNQISILRNQVDIEIQKDQRLHSIKQLLSDLNPELGQIDSFFVKSDGVVSFLEYLESLGRSINLSITVNSVSVNDQSDNGLPYDQLKIEFVAQGFWGSITQFLSLLEASPYGVIVERVQLERIPSSRLWQANIGFSVSKLK